ncbi:Aminomethyltransferase, mitochondrial, variant 2 [Arthrobotrys conoides]|uniref:Aminomethyltransferase n=1 Tax=Arthrobotrys conoides TaxID=74498 RepID=A0AAN8RQB4_9PEZI
MASRALNRNRKVVELSRVCFMQQRAISTAPRPYKPAAPLPSRSIPRQISSVRTIPVRHARYSSSSSAPLLKTPLYDLHVRYEGKMVEFGGHAMPVQYADQGIGESHRYVREACGLFDVSHMVQHQFTGPTAAAFLESFTPSDLKALEPFSSTLSVLLLPTGGIVDDTIITKHDDNAFYVVTNAGCRDKDLAFLSDKLKEWNAQAGEGEQVRHDVLARGLVALQGPEASKVLQSLLKPEDEALDSTLFFGQSKFATITVDGEDVPIHIARGGYTGEDGFEISIPADKTEAVVEAMLDAEDCVTKLAGLGARDSLRLEAGMCLYGHDIDENTTPVEGNLTWLVAKSRRKDANFPGASTILKQIKEGPSKRRVGLIVNGAPAREGAVIKTADGEKIGVITSGCPSPTLGKNIAMGYVEEKYKKAGTEVIVEVRGKPRQAVIAKMPFVPAKYHKSDGGSSPDSNSGSGIFSAFATGAIFASIFD